MKGACPVCQQNNWTRFAAPDLLRMETLLRAQFVFDRLSHPPSPQERKDLTDFAHGSAASLLQCRTCCTLLRKDSAEPLSVYSEDSYDAQVMERLLPRYVDAFAQKHDPYHGLLPPSSKVLEIGPHMGGFLEVARSWGWHAEGVDVGSDTAAFLNARGLTTRHGTLEQCAYPPAHFDGIFVWNCFEQIPHPRALLSECSRILKRGGKLVLRIPNALFYTVCRGYLETSTDPELTVWVTCALGYSNLLGWPYLHGYRDEHLDLLAARNSLTRIAALNSELIILPFPDLPQSLIAEKRACLAAIREFGEFERLTAAGRLTGPWIELIYETSLQ